MEILELKSRLDQLILEFNNIGEDQFIRGVSGVARENKRRVIETFTVFLNKNINLQLKYFILRSIEDLKYPDFIPVLQSVLDKPEKVRIINQAAKCLIEMNSLPAYKVITDSLPKPHISESRRRIGELLSLLFSRNPLIYHFDVFYTRKEKTKKMRMSSDFLIKNLPAGYVRDVLASLTNIDEPMNFEILRILSMKPNRLFYPPIFRFFKTNHALIKGEDFQIMAEALIINAGISRSKVNIFRSLKDYLDLLDSNERKIFSVLLLKLNTAEMVEEVIKEYPVFDFQQKLLFFQHLDKSNQEKYSGFIKTLFLKENNENILNIIVKILLDTKDFGFLFTSLRTIRMNRRKIILKIILDFDPEGIELFIRKYVSPAQSNVILYGAVEYLLKHSADKDYKLIKGILVSGVSQEIKILIIRNLEKFSSNIGKNFLAFIFKNIQVIELVKKDYLMTLLKVLSKKEFSVKYEHSILEQILIMLEEAEVDDIVNFIYFFEKYTINNVSDAELIIQELKMIQNTLIKSTSKDDFVRMIHLLIHKIKKKFPVLHRKY